MAVSRRERFDEVVECDKRDVVRNCDAELAQADERAACRAAVARKHRGELDPVLDELVDRVAAGEPLVLGVHDQRRVVGETEPPDRLLVGFPALRTVAGLARQVGDAAVSVLGQMLHGGGDPAPVVGHDHRWIEAAAEEDERMTVLLEAARVGGDFLRRAEG